MEGTEFIIAALAIISGTGLAGYIFMNIFKLIRSWIGGSSEVPEDEFNRLARAFMEHKKETQRRIQNLEAIIADDESSEESPNKETPNQIEASKESIEFDDSEDLSEKSTESGSDRNENNLRNMLRE